MREAVECAVQLRQTETWRSLALAALDVLEIDVAINSYRQVGTTVQSSSRRFVLAPSLLSACTLAAIKCTPLGFCDEPLRGYDTHERLPPFLRHVAGRRSVMPAWYSLLNV